MPDFTTTFPHLTLLKIYGQTSESRIKTTENNFEIVIISTNRTFYKGL